MLTEWLISDGKKVLPYRESHFDKIAMCRTKALAHIKDDPLNLFQYVGQRNSCMCGGTCGCLKDDIDFLDLVIEHKTVGETDIVDMEDSSSRCYENKNIYKDID